MCFPCNKTTISFSNITYNLFGDGFINWSHHSIKPKIWKKITFRCFVCLFSCCNIAEFLILKISVIFLFNEIAQLKWNNRCSWLAHTYVDGSVELDCNCIIYSSFICKIRDYTVLRSGFYVLICRMQKRIQLLFVFWCLVQCTTAMTY